MIGETVTRLRATATADPYSGENGDLDWTSPAAVDIHGCAFDPGTSAEQMTAWREGMSVTPTLYAPPSADITARDRVRVRGKVYEVAGEPAVWRSPWTGETFPLVVPLSKFGG